ncbi:pirin family protein [Gulosibacter molinativorax]|uniref:Pirin family protein n=1 Tax=Gulosibacter molinativorax TaxID=256821 RepID=A0ABT7C6G6_9MICO|nr:pirin family protein [Gulosibacter molinativorax]MDJ1370364.1 pirin family protein [Gulosibacter molinativorax]QUY61277.1 Quercetin 2,3-dioxygenase [Gulosibacter molinativorax]
MSNTEHDPEERVCENRSYTTAGLRTGVIEAGEAVSFLEPRFVPLGGPRAMTVKRLLPQRARSLVGPWCFLDFYGPDDVSKTGGMAVPRHPHTGLATVSWLFEGAIDHIDSAGNWATVTPGDAVFMNAGRGITHSEFSTEETTVLHGAQLWYAFPHENRFVEPSLDNHRPEPVQGKGWVARVFAGELLGAASSLRTYAELSGAELRLEPRTVLEIAVPASHEHALLPVWGEVWVSGQPVLADHLAVVDAGQEMIRIEAGDAPVLALFIGGEPLGEPIVMWWNFIGRDHDEIVAFREEYQREMGFERDGEPGTERDTEQELRFGTFPPRQPDPLPAPELPITRMKPRSQPSRTTGTEPSRDD